MPLSIAYLGPAGTNTEAAASAYAKALSLAAQPEAPILCPYPSIILSLKAVASGQVEFAVVPAENSIEGSVTVTLDSLWQLDTLKIRQALLLPIVHALISQASSLETIQTVFSHPQALSQCQKWLAEFLPQVELVSMSSTTEALHSLAGDPTAAAISSQRAAQLYNLPVLASSIQDYPENCTRFWVLEQACPLSASTDALVDTTVTHAVATENTYTSLAFSVPANTPGALVQPLQVFAKRQINLSRIESRPSKRLLGEYVFFIDLEAGLTQPAVQSALRELANHTETLKVFGSYTAQQIE